MKKLVKKSVKKVKKASKEVVLDEKVLVCVACSGSGLERPTFTHSPLCSACNGTGTNA